MISPPRSFIIIEENFLIGHGPLFLVSTELRLLQIVDFNIKFTSMALICLSFVSGILTYFFSGPLKMHKLIKKEGRKYGPLPKVQSWNRIRSGN
jgi:hypothetical protein